MTKSYFAPGCRSLKDVFALFTWKKVDAEIRSASGEAFFSQKGVEAPVAWSQLAIEVAASKYFRRKGEKSKVRESSMKELITRVVNSISMSAKAQKYFASSGEAQAFSLDLSYILLSQKAAFNSPVYFNLGLYESYGLKGQTPNYAWDEKSKKIKKQSHSYLRPQVSACFIQSVGDSIESLYELAKNEAQLFKFGSGSGTNFSAVRSRYEEIETGGTSSGLMSFLEMLDRGAAAIKSGGTTRRAAKMVCLDVDHPEILDFIQWKVKEEDKAQALIREGYDGGFDGEAYRSVSGQNSNNSVRVSNEFMQRLEKSQDWPLRSRTSGKILRQISAAELWQEMAKAAYRCGDPAVQFDSLINSWHTCPGSGAIRASNPCSEYMFVEDSACNLSSLNLLQFIKNGKFLLQDYSRVCQVMITAQEILVDLAGYPTEKIALHSHELRPLGLGFCGLGAFLMRLGVPYDSELGRSWASGLTALLTGEAYLLSTRWAEKKNPIASWKKNRSAFLRILQRHQKAMKQLTGADEALLEDARKIWHEVLVRAKKFGVRNAQVSLMAPTGTIGLMMDCDTTGIEPEFALLKSKLLAGGGEKKIFSQSFHPALEILGYSQQEIKKIMQHLEDRGTLLGAPGLKTEHHAIFATAQGEKNFTLSPDAHLLMMAAVQPFVSGAISKTINLPSSATVEMIADTYLRAYQLGLKSVAVYRDGSKGLQPLAAVIPCATCGAATRLTGGCFVCENCGTSTGCTV